MTRPNLTFIVRVLSWYIQNSYQLYCEADAYSILQYLKGAPKIWLYYRLSFHLNIKSYSYTNWTGDLFILIGLEILFIGTLLLVIVFSLEVIWWRGKVNPQSSGEVEYRVMANSTCEMMWIQFVLLEMDVFYNNNQWWFIVRIKWPCTLPIILFFMWGQSIEVNSHFIRNMVM